MSANTNSRIYRVGDYVYVETAPVYPYQIRRIEELTKLGNGQIEAKVQCFYRRRDLSTPLIAQADRHAAAAEEDAEIDMGDVELDDTKMHQLSHRELFLSRQYETINASQIRGKCLVTLYCETETLPRYTGKEDWFYYCLVYDPQQKALLADKGETGIGSNYQPIIPPKLEDTNTDTRDLAQLETMIWKTDHNLTDREVDQFLVVSRSVGTFARALDCSSSVKQPSLHMSAAAASRDITQFHALCVLHKSSYDLSKAVGCLVPSGGPVLCRDEMEEWSAGEAGLFEEAINKYGKDFSDIQKDFLPWKSISSIIEYYYMWKTTDRYVRQKRMKNVEKESDLKQILVSNPPGTTCVTGSGDKESVNSIPYPPPGVITKPPSPGYSCESCYANTSTHWFPWSAPNNQYRHYVCSVCWVYWKKYGGLKEPDGFSSRRVGEEVRYTCRLCGKVFNRAALLSNHMVTHKPFKCFVNACDKTFNTEANLTRHLSASHSLRPRSPPHAKPKPAFFMKVLPLTKISRYLCTEFLKFPHLARVFNVPLEINDIRQACMKRVSREVAEKIIAARKIKTRKPLESIVEVLKASPPKVTSDVTMTPQTSTHVTKTRSKSTSGMHPSPITSPTRKMLHSPRLYVPQINVNEVAEPRQAHSSKHLLSRKRSLENVNTHHQNGLDGPAPKRFVSNSPLGKKGCECKHCGKVLHNQASLSHHMQTVHAVSFQPSQGGPPKQKSYPAYCDVNPGMGPGVTKMAPYAEHTVTSYNTNPGLKSPPQPPNTLPINPPLLSKPMAPPKQPLSSPALGPGLNRKLTAPAVKNHSAVNGQNKSRGRSSPTRQPQFIDPPEEFVFSATKVMRSARKSIAEVMKRRLPRKPWMEVKCPPELRELIYRTRKPRKTKEKSPTKSDHILSDGKTASPVKIELNEAEVVTPLIAVADEKPAIVSPSVVPPGSIEVQPGVDENIGVPTDKESVSPVEQEKMATAAGGALPADGAGVAGDAVDSGTPGKAGATGGTNVDEPIVIDD